MMTVSLLFSFLWEKVNSSMSNKMVLYPDHFVGPCVNHLEAQAHKKKREKISISISIFMHIGMGMLQNNQIIRNYVF